MVNPDLLDNTLPEADAAPLTVSAVKAAASGKAWNARPAQNKTIPPKPVPVRENHELPETLGENTRLVYSKLLPEPMHIDDIVRASRLEPQKVFTALTELEIYGFVTLISGKRYVLI